MAVRVAAAVMCLLGAAAFACATGTSPDGSDDGASADASSGRPADAGAPDATAVIASACPPEEFAVGFDPDGLLECAAIDSAATTAINEHCSIYLGWRDSCDGCTAAPAKWGRASGASCLNGVGAHDTCLVATLGGVDVNLFGLNTDGDVNDDDKFYVGWHCVASEEAPVAGPCPDGSYVSAVTPDGVECVTARDAIVEYASGSCGIYTGWRDNCDGCAAAPTKWGRTDGALCTNGAGVHNTCTQPVLGDQTVRTFGLNLDGDVNNDDKFYVGFQCTGAVASDGLVDQTCPAGELVIAIEADGRVRCASPLPAAEAVLQTSCHLYLGWRDTCDGCALAPTKWGRVSHAACENGVGANNTCASTALGDTPLPLFGLNTDGDVDGNDKLYVGLQCL